MVAKPHPSLLSGAAAIELGDVVLSVGILLIVVGIRRGVMQGVSRKFVALFALSLLFQQVSRLSVVSKHIVNLFAVTHYQSWESVVRLAGKDEFALLLTIVRIVGLSKILFSVRRRSLWGDDGGRDRANVFVIVSGCVVAALIVESRGGFDFMEVLRSGKAKGFLPLLRSSIVFLQGASLLPQLAYDEQRSVKRDAMLDFALCCVAGPSVAAVYAHIVSGAGVPAVLISRTNLVGIVAALQTVLSVPFWIQLVQRRFLAAVVVGMAGSLLAAGLNFSRVLAVSHLTILFLTPLMSGLMATNLGFACLYWGAYQAGLVQLPAFAQRLLK